MGSPSPWEGPVGRSPSPWREHPFLLCANPAHPGVVLCSPSFVEEPFRPGIDRLLRPMENAAFAQHSSELGSEPTNPPKLTAGGFLCALHGGLLGGWGSRVEVVGREGNPSACCAEVGAAGPTNNWTRVRADFAKVVSAPGLVGGGGRMVVGKRHRSCPYSHHSEDTAFRGWWVP